MTSPSDDVAIPTTAATPVLSYHPLALSAPGRAVELQVRVTAPATGGDLPLLLLSHGHGGSNFASSLYGYGPLATFYAAHGFVVVQPTHLDSKTLALDPGGPEGALFWRSRAEDMTRILDQIGTVEAETPRLAGRLDRTRVAAVGHSMGGHTVGLLLGMSATDPVDGTPAALADDRVQAGVLMGAPGRGADIAEFAGEHFPILGSTSFATMTRPALVVVGDEDASPVFSDRRDWRADAYTDSPAPTSLLTVFGAGHLLGGVSGYDQAETTDENPGRVALVCAMSWAYLRSSVNPDDPAWADARAAVARSATPPARTDSRELLPER